MNEKQILKEIAYYSKLIDSHKKRNEKSQYVSNGHFSQTYDAYKSKNLYNNIKFVNSRSYNPNINSYNVNLNSHKTYVKPNSLDVGNLNINQSDKYKYVKKTEPTVISSIQEKITHKVLINPNFKTRVHINPHFNKQKIHVNPKILAVSDNILKSNVKTSQIKPVNINLTSHVNSPVKYVKSIPATNNLNKMSIINKTPVRKRRLSIRSKYKIVKSNTPKISPQSKVIVKNKYKIDRRSKMARVKSSLKKKVIYPNVNENLRTSLFRNKTWRRSSLKSDQGKLNSNIKSQTKTRIENGKIKKTFISARGEKYIMDAKNRTLRLISSSPKNKSAKKVNVKGITYVMKSPSVYVKSPNSSTSRARKISSSNFRKNNIPCPVYHRFGKCRRKEAGRCMFKHNPDQIALCKKFLQGACLSEDCPLSHKVSLEKMPTCKYYLEGCCFRMDCQYLHVKISPNAEICKDFLEGFCRAAVKCNKRHQYLCPEFERHGKCPKRKCRYPHKSKCTKDKIVKNTKPEIAECTVDNKVELVEQPEVGRYYLDKNAEDINEEKVSDNIKAENEEVYKRVKLGTLPSFIPFD